MELSIEELNKRFGTKSAVSNISVTLQPGVYGLLGANGAGKTTLMRMVCNILKPTSGRILYDGEDINRLEDNYRNLLGYLPQDFGYYPDFTAKEYLEFILGQLSELEEITYRAMMGEFIIYYRGKIVGGIYDDRLLVKPVKSAISYMPTAPYELPYEGAKEMLLVDEVDNKEFLTGLFNAMYEELPTPKSKKKK